MISNTDKSERKLKGPWGWKAKRRLKFWTNVCLIIAILAGIAIAIEHGGNISTAIVWSAAALAGGSILGFLFGIPGRSGRRIVINQPGVAAIDTGISRASGTGGVGTTTSQPSGATNENASGAGADAANSTDASGAAPKNAASNAPNDQSSASTDPSNTADTGGTGRNPLNAGSGATDSSGAGAGASNPAIRSTAGANPSDASGTPTTTASGQGTDAQMSEDSNLVQVSDWVTKLLLGGGLTQLQQIPPKIWELAAWVALGIDPSAAVRGQEARFQSNQAFAAGLLIYFFILGFFGGYFVTQLQFKKRLQS